MIPVHNDDCRRQVAELCRQLEASTDLLRYEVIVADDGSTDGSCPERCREVAQQWPCVRFIDRRENVGRARIRNFLATAARYEWLLFIDAELMPRDSQFIARYAAAEGDGIICGNYVVGGTPDKQNLRCLYEHAIAPQHAYGERLKRPFQHFHTANFAIRRELMLAHPFDERFSRYGYEDVLFGKQLRAAGIGIEHIDNPVVFETFEPNERFVAKTEEALTTLHEFRDEIRGYSRLLTFVAGIHLQAVVSLIRLWHRLFGPLERRQLCGRRPSLRVFSLYKLGYYLNLK